MKIAFLAVSLLCAVALSMLSYVLATGNVPFHPPPIPSESLVTEADLAQPAAILSERSVVTNLIEMLETERLLYEQKKTELEASRSTEKIEYEMKARQELKNEMQRLKEKLENALQSMESSEKANLQSLADVYGKMDPENAAKILVEMDKQKSALIISLMADRSAAGILNAVSELGPDATKTAVEWTDIIRKLHAEKKENK